MRRNSGGWSQAWIGLAIAGVGLALVFGTESWRWLGAIAFVGGLLLVMLGPADAGIAAHGGAQRRGSGHSCCVPRERASEASARRARAHH